MKDKNLKSKFLKKNEPGYILAFALIVVAILLTASLSVSRMIIKEMFFSRLVDNSRAAYFSADSGIECAQYIDNIIKDDSVAVSLILNSISSANANQEFVNNANTSVFFSTSTVKVKRGIDSLNNVTCASDETSTYNKIFYQGSPNSTNAGYVNSRDAVIDNLNKGISSYTIVGNGGYATTTFGFILKDIDVTRCVLVDFAKKKSTSSSTLNLTDSFAITSAGYSDCNPADKGRVIRTIYRYSTDTN